HGNRYGRRDPTRERGRRHCDTESSALSDWPHHSWRAARQLPHMKIKPASRRLGILLSGRGSNFEAIAQHIASGKLRAEIAVVISNVATAAGLDRAHSRGLNAVCLPSRQKAREDFDREAVEILKHHDVSL